MKEECNRHHNNLDVKSANSCGESLQNDMLADEGCSIERLKIKLKFSAESNEVKNPELPVRSLFE